MQITIVIDTDNFTPTDRELLAALSGSSVVSTKVDKPAKAVDKPAKVDTDVEQRSKEPEEVKVDEEAATDGPTLEDAVSLATKLVSNGRAKDVKAALTAVGAKRVSGLKGDAVAAFIDELS